MTVREYALSTPTHDNPHAPRAGSSSQTTTSAPLLFIRERLSSYSAREPSVAKSTYKSYLVFGSFWLSSSLRASALLAKRAASLGERASLGLCAGTHYPEQSLHVHRSHAMACLTIGLRGSAEPLIEPCASRLGQRNAEPREEILTVFPSFLDKKQSSLGCRSLAKSPATRSGAHAPSVHHTSTPFPCMGARAAALMLVLRLL